MVYFIIICIAIAILYFAYERSIKNESFTKGDLRQKSSVFVDSITGAMGFLVILGIVYVLINSVLR